MNEQAIIDSYNLFVQNGYNKSLQDFKQLISSNPNALNDSYGLFQKNGYKRSLDDYKILVGVGAPVSPEAQAPVAPELKKKDDTTALPSGLGSSVSSVSVPEEDYFQGTFGNILRGFDSVSPIGIGDFADDMARAVASGYRQGDVAQAANKLLISGTTPSLEEIQNLLDKQQKLEQLGGSKEFQDYQKTYEEAGKGVWGFVKGVIQNPSILPEIMISSMVSMATNRDAVIAGLGAVGTGATAGAVTAGGLTLGAGAAPGAVAGAVASVPYAFGLASTIVETGATFSELLNEELGGKDSSAENVKAILEDPEKLNDIRNKAIARGITIGAIDAFTGKLASGVGAKILSKSAAGSATGAATKAAVTKATAAGTAIEAAGGSTGEAAARGLIGQDMDTGEILLEGIAEMPGGVKSTLMARFAKPVYKVNGRNVDAQEIDNLLETMTPEQLAVSKIDIKNDYEGRQVRLQDKIVTNTIKEEVKQAQPDLNEPTLNAIVDLQKQLNTLEGNKTEVAKEKAAQIRAEIKNLQENPITETKPVQEDAIQEQAAGQVPVQSGTTVSQEVAQGEPQAEPQVTAEEGQAKEEVKPSDEKFFEEMDVIFPNDHIGGGYAATDSEGNLLGRISMSSVDDNTVKIDEVVSEKRGQRTGNGSAIMRIVTENADKNNTTLTLTPNLIGGMKAKGFETPKKLEAFYEKFGFVKDKQKATMTRLPKQLEVTAVSPAVSPVAPTAPETTTAVSPAVELTDDQIVEYNPTEEVSDKNNEVLGKVLQSKKFEPQAEPQRTDLGDSVVFEYNNFDDNETRTRFTFNKKKDGTITGVGVKVERNVGDIRNTDLFRNYVNSKRAEAAAQPEVTAQPTVSPQPTTLTEAEQIAKMEEMFTQKETPTPIAPTDTATTSGVNVADPIGMDSLRKRVQDNAKKQVIDFAQKTLTTLKSVLPDFEIVVHDDENSYRNAMASVNGPAESAGYFSYVQRPDGTYVGKIDINLNKANNATVAHEVAHGVMRKAFGENVESFRTLKNRIASVLNQEGNQALTDFASQYEENDSYEEYLVELAAQLTQADKNISPTLLQNIASIINEVVSKITNGAFTPFQNVKDTKQTIEFLRNISESIRKGEAINPADITAIQEGLSVPIGSPTTINPLPKGKASLNFPKAPLPLSFVTEADKIDINALIDDIVAKKQKIWFWMADQLGRGNYYDEVIEGEHYLDAGPSFALDPTNRSKGILWASGLPEKTLTNQINQADYIFFISGSPEKAKLFNKRVLDLLADRINKTSDFNKFKEAINNFEKETVELKTIKDALNEVNSFKELADSPKRKPFLISIGEIGSLKTAPKGSLKELLGSFNAFIDYNELRDGFYRENDFNQNDIMLVGKPTGVSGKAPHSTYEFAISGEVVGVPDKKIDSWDIMPESIKEKYKDVIGGREGKTKPMQTKVIAAETGVIRELEPRMKGKAQLIGKNANLSAAVKFNQNLAEDMDKNKVSPQTIREVTGWEKGKDGNWKYEIPDGKFKDIDLDDLKEEKRGTKNVRVAKLGDIFTAPDLYDAYPKAKEIKIVFEDLPDDELGGFDRPTQEISINTKYYNNNREVAELTMLHEIQHYIQTVEFFESGSNPALAKGIMKYLLDDVRDVVRKAKNVFDFTKDFYKDSDNKNPIEKSKATYDKAKNDFKKIRELALHKDTKEEKARKIAFAEDASKKQGRKITVDDIYGVQAASAYNLYYRIAGEVEARNIEYRAKLTPEQRRKTLLSETENIDRADQILYDYQDLNLQEDIKGKAQLNTEAKAKKVVQQARAQGFSEEVIKSFLESKGISKADIKKAMAKDVPAAGRVTLSEDTISGYDSLMKRIEDLIVKGVESKEVISKLKNSKAYTAATDVQKEKLVREVRKMLGLRQKSAPTAKRILGQLKDITKITMTETQVLKKRIKELAEGAAAAKKSIAEANKFLADEIKQMVTDGKITLNQATSLTVRALKMNPLSEASISNFVDYVAKVFSKAEYVGKMTTALAQIKKAKENIKTKIGVAEDLFIPLKQLLSINPTLIPLNQLEKYLGILEDFGARKAVLSIDDRVKVLKEVNEILEEVSNELSSVDVLADRFNNYDEQVFNEEGGLNYAATIKKMIDDGLISTDEADLMRKYKSEILPQVERTDLTEEEIAEQKKEEIKILKALKIDNKEFPLPSRDEKEDALNLSKLIKELSESDLMNLSLPDLKNIIKVIENINNGYLPHYAKISIEKLDAIKEGKVLSSAIERAKPLSFSKLYSRLKDKFTNKGAVDELIRANPLYYIDNVFGDFKTRDIFNSLLEQSSQALARFNSELKRVSQKIDIAQNKVLASFNQNPDKYLMSKFRMTTYMLQREYESNIGKKGVRPVSDYLKETIKHIRKGKSVFKEADAEKLENILEELDTYTVDGTVDLDKFYNTFNNAEKNAIKVMTEINASLGEKAAYTSSVIRGNKVELMDNYFHHNVLHEQNPMDATAAPEFSSSYSNSMRPTTKAKSLIERTGALTPLNFDLFTSTQKGAKFVLLDYNLTSPIRTARRTLIQAEKNLESKGLMNKEKIQIFNAINNAYEEALENILTNNISQDDLSNEVFDFIQKQGYRAALAGTTRFQAELASNIVNALIINPKGFATGIKHAKLIASANGYEFMNNAKSKQTSRLYSTDALSGRMVDPQILKQTSGIKGSISRSALRNRTAQIYNLTLKRFVQNPVEYIADTMLTTPDKVVSMPLWFGSFMNEFKRITGEEVNQEMMINNDLDYMQKYADAIEQATRKADQESVYSGAANNEFMGVLKGKLKPNQGLTQKLWNNFNSYMTNFMNFDYAAARSAVYNLFNEGYMTKKKATAVLAGITTRSIIYQIMVANMGAGIVGAALGLAFDWEDEEEVDEKSFFQKVGRGLTNVLVGYTVGRNFGNAVRGMINFGVEKINEEYLDFLRSGEYDFYKDNIAYTYLNVGDRGDIDVPKMAISMAGAYSPALNTAVLIGKNFGALSSRVMGEGPTKKEPDAIRREDMTVNYRIPLEVAGNLGLIPLYKDVKKAVNDEIYKDLRKAANTPDSSIPNRDEYEKLKDLRELKSKIKDEDERKALDKKIVEITGSEEAKAAIDKQKEALTARKKRLLYDSSKGQRYDNESDMKRLNPSLWRKRFGPNSEWAKKTKAKEAVESKLEKESKAREDREFKKKKRGN